MANVLMVKDIEGLTIQCSRREGINHALDVSSFPVETGLDVTDHASVKPIIFDIDFAISTADVTHQLNNPALISEAYQHMTLLQNTLRKCVIITGIASFTDMLLVSIQATRYNHAGNVISFSCTFLQVRYAVAANLSAQQVAAYGSNKGASTQLPAPDADVSPAQDNGTAETGTADSNSDQTALFSIFNG